MAYKVTAHKKMVCFNPLDRVPLVPHCLISAGRQYFCFNPDHRCTSPRLLPLN